MKSSRSHLLTLQASSPLPQHPSERPHHAAPRTDSVPHSHTQVPLQTCNPSSSAHWKTAWFWNPVRGLSLIAAALLLGSCNARSNNQAVTLPLHQQWQLQPGTTIANTRISSGLGDLVLDLNGQALYMPKAGRIEALTPMQESPTGAPSCVAVSSPEIPAYKLRLCHLEHLRLGQHPQGATIGRGKQVAIAMLRKQPEGTWAFVEPAPSLLEALLQQP